MFNDFWAIYPKKVAKKDAEKAWNRLTEAQKATALEALPAHAQRWDDPQYMPHAATWLNGERFDDELPQIVSVKKSDWWASESGIIGKGAELKMTPRAGESMPQFKSRVQDAINGVPQVRQAPAIVTSEPQPERFRPNVSLMSLIKKREAA